MRRIVLAALAKPSTWTIMGPVKQGNGPGKTSKGDYAKDLEEKANVKRMFAP